MIVTYITYIFYEIIPNFIVRFRIKQHRSIRRRISSKTKRIASVPVVAATHARPVLLDLPPLRISLPLSLSYARVSSRECFEKIRISAILSQT